MESIHDNNVTFTRYSTLQDKHKENNLLKVHEIYILPRTIYKISRNETLVLLRTETNPYHCNRIIKVYMRFYCLVLVTIYIGLIVYVIGCFP